MADAEVPSPTKHHLDILRFVKDSQSRNGLRHQDYMRYRQYCTRRLRRLYGGVNLRHGRGKYQKKVIDASMVSDVRVLHVVLMSAERCWSYAMELKSQDEAEAVTTRRRHHMINRLKKACVHADLLVSLAHECGTNATVLEAEAYAHWMHGNYQLEREVWADALKRFTGAKAIYDELCPVGEASNRRAWMQRSDEIETTIRYCRYNVEREHGGAGGDAGLLDLERDATSFGLDLVRSKLDTLLSDARRQKAAAMETISWRGKTLKIEEERVRVAILRTREVWEELCKVSSEEKGAWYDKGLLALSEALKFVQDELQAMGGAGGASSRRVEETTGGLVDVHGYLREQQTLMLMARDRELAWQYADNYEARQATGRSKKATSALDVARMYDKLVRHVRDFRTVVEEVGVPETEDEAALRDAEHVTYQAWKSFFAAEGFVQEARWGEAVLLYGRAAKLADVAVRMWANVPSIDDVSKAENEANRLSQMQQRASSGACVSHAHAVVAQQSKLEEKEAAQREGTTNIESGVASASLDDDGGKVDVVVPLLQRLGRYTETVGPAAPLAEFPPRFHAIPSKPFLFDLAGTAITFPSLEEVAAPASQGGGWLGGWFGGRK